MSIKQRFSTNTQGSISVLFAVFLAVAIIVMGVSVDLARAYLVRNKLQTALDASLLGAVSSAGTVDVQTEMENLFRANYPENYMGSSVTNTTVTEVNPGIYRMEVSVSVPNMVMKTVGYSQMNVALVSEVERGLNQVNNPPKPEIAFVLDVSSSMKAPANCSALPCSEPAKIEALQEAVIKTLDVLYGNRDSIPGVAISFIPYSNKIKISPGRPEWVKSSQVTLASKDPTVAYNPQYGSMYTNYIASGYGYFNQLSNRYFCPACQPYANGGPGPTTTYDLTDTPPTGGEETKFVLETSAGILSTLPPPLKFAMNNKTEMKNYISAFVGYGTNTRINVGLFWGWMTLSPNWRGVWDSSDFPHNYNDPRHPKILVLLTDGVNSFPADNATTSQLCTIMKSKNITIYTVAFDMDVFPQSWTGYKLQAESMLRNCATDDSYYFKVGTSDELSQAFSQIADDILFRTMRITE